MCVIKYTATTETYTYLHTRAHHDALPITAAAELGKKAVSESRTVASLLANGGARLDESHVLVVDEAGQLGNRQALRLLEISKSTGARLLLIGDTRQTGAIEQEIGRASCRERVCQDV